MSDINNLFALLDDWRCLPAYQLERRADIFFALHLKDILYRICKSEIDEIIPEFPIRKGSLPQNPQFNKNPKVGENQSFKIDYLAYSESENLVYFIELKTEARSRNQKQDWYLEIAKERGMHKIIEDLKKIYEASHKNGRIKYRHLFKKLNEFGLIKGYDESFIILKTHLDIEIRYIQPCVRKQDENKELIITYEDINCVLKKDSTRPLTKRFLESLKTWQSDCEKLVI